MIKGTLRGIRSLKAFLYFGGDQNLFEKEIIKGFTDGIILGNTYNFSKEEVEVFVQVHIDEDVTETTIETVKYPKNLLIEYAIDVETYHCIHFLHKNFYEEDNYGKHQWLFTRILKCYLSTFNVNIVDYPYRDLYIEYFTEIVKTSISLYEGIFANQFNLREVKIKLKTDLRTNKTGYKLKPYLYNTKIKPFTDRLIQDGFIESKDRDKFKQFLQGEILKEPIEWKRELRYFVHFIKKLTSKKDKSPEYLLSPPGQRWKYLYTTFSHKHSKLKENFNETDNKLGKKSQKEIDIIFDILK